MALASLMIVTPASGVTLQPQLQHLARQSCGTAKPDGQPGAHEGFHNPRNVCHVDITCLITWTFVVSPAGGQPVNHADL